MSLLQEMSNKAARLGVPFSVHLDLTYRCNERCVHCYLDHDDHGEMNTEEIHRLLGELAGAGVFMLTLSGGEIFVRKDFFEILKRARELAFMIKLKTNAVMIRENEARRIRELGVEFVQVSVYSDKPEIHDAITLVPGSLQRTINGIRLLQREGIRVILANVLMRQNFQDYKGVKALADEIGAHYTIDPTVTPMMDGDRSILSLNVEKRVLEDIFRDTELGAGMEDMCAPPKPMAEDELDSVPCSAGHTACYVSPYGDVYPCVQFPLPSGNVRTTPFLDIWRHSEQLNEVRSISMRDLPSCSKCVHGGSCSRCPGLAYMEGNMRGPSIQDCEKSFARTGIPSVNLLAKRQNPAPITGLVQIQALGAAGLSQISAA